MRRALRFELRRARLARAAPRPSVPGARAKGLVPRILVCGWYGTETLGDKAILAGLVLTLGKLLGRVEVVIGSLHPEITAATLAQMPELAGVALVSLERAVALAGSQDLVLFGGGPIMPGEDLACAEAVMLAARRAAVPTMAAGCGVGPVDLYPGAARHVRRLLGLADRRLYRDFESREAARSLGLDVTADLVAEDPAFLWLDSLASSPVREGGRSGRRTLLLGLREFPAADYAARRTDRLRIGPRLGEALRTTLDRLVAERPDLQILPLPMCTHRFGPDDRLFYRDLFAPASAAIRGRLDLSLLGAELTPAAYAAAFRSADVALTMRFHALVFALGLKVPAVAIDYSFAGGKVAALAKLHGVEAFPADTVDSDALFHAVLAQLASPRCPDVRVSLMPSLGRMLSDLGLRTDPAARLAA